MKQLLQLFRLSIITSLVILGNIVSGVEPELAMIPYDSPDPTAIETPDGFVYVFTTRPGIAISRSKDLVHWEPVGRVFAEVAPEWARERIPKAKNVWAPDITFHHGRYHLYYSVSTFGSQRSVIGLATNATLDPESPNYRWIDEGLVLESDPQYTDYNAIDPALLVDHDGRTYLYWGSYWRGLRAVEVDAATGKPQSYRDPQTVGGLQIPSGEVVVAKRIDHGDSSIEAPYVVHRGDFYWLFTSRGSCCDGVKSTYHIVVGRSDSPLGPFVDRDALRLDEGFGTLLLESTDRWKGTGHNGIVQTTAGDGTKRDWIILAAYDAKRPNLGRLTQLRSITFPTDAAGWLEISEIYRLPE